MPGIAKNHGATVIYVNRDPTSMDELADIFLKGSASELLMAVMEKVKT